MPEFRTVFVVADLPEGPFDGDSERAGEWLAEAAHVLQDNANAHVRELLDGYIQQEIALGNLTDEPDEGSLSFWDEFPMPEAEPESRFPAHWSSDPAHPVTDWQYEVANGDTRLGYRDWVGVQKGLD